MRTTIGTIALTSLLVTGGLHAETTLVTAGRDATLIEDPQGALANGAGPFVFAGRTAQQAGAVRRALLWFDVAGAIPSQALVESATLTLCMTPSHPDPRVLSLHRVLHDWSEGPAAAAGGGGAPAQPGDVTWIHTSWDVELWPRPGGQLVESASASATVAEPGCTTWTSDRLARDVQVWLSAPRRNFGWALLGDETAPQSVKAFASRENPDPALWPVLEVVWRLPGD